jgi:geranylgeranyl diphosphate synthase type I
MAKEALGNVFEDSSLHSTNHRSWYLLPLIVYGNICGQCETVLPAIAGLQLLKAAADVLDDIEDADSVGSLSYKYGVPLALNAATTLIILAEKAFTRLEDKGVSDETVVRLIRAVNSYYVTACMGQHLDLSLSPDEAILEEKYLRVIAMKSASVMECACYAGAMLTTANEDLINSFTIFGHNLGMASQIANDIKGVVSLNDIKRGKITLPAIYALSQTDGENRRLLEKAFRNRSGILEFNPDRIRDLLYSTGAIQYAFIKEEMFKQLARDGLTFLETRGVETEQLLQFLN